jgi:hypothetical protein
MKKQLSIIYCSLFVILFSPICTKVYSENSKPLRKKLGRYYASEAEEGFFTRIGNHLKDSVTYVKDSLAIFDATVRKELQNINKGITTALTEGVTEGKSVREKEYFNGKTRAEAAAKWFFRASIKKTSSKPRITWIGHATFLIQVGEINILTDPVFGNLSPILYRRTRNPT